MEYRIPAVRPLTFRYGLLWSRDIPTLQEGRFVKISAASLKAKAIHMIIHIITKETNYSTGV